MMLRSHGKEDDSQSSFRHTVEISSVKGTCGGGVLPFSVNVLEVAVLVDMSLQHIFLSFEPELKASMLFQVRLCNSANTFLFREASSTGCFPFDEAGRR
jgi:hypothetical protein